VVRLKVSAGKSFPRLVIQDFHSHIISTSMIALSGQRHPLWGIQFYAWCFQLDASDLIFHRSAAERCDDTHSFHQRGLLAFVSLRTCSWGDSKQVLNHGREHYPCWISNKKNMVVWRLISRVGQVTKTPSYQCQLERTFYWRLEAIIFFSWSSFYSPSWFHLYQWVPMYEFCPQACVITVPRFGSEAVS